MFDFTDCLVDGPMRGDVGYLGDNEELLEYPCNCIYCRDKAGVVSEEEWDSYEREFILLENVTK